MSWWTQYQRWAPTDHAGESAESHMGRMYYWGHPQSKLVYFNPVITILSAVLLWGFCIYAMLAKDDAEKTTSEWQEWVTRIWNWLYMASQNIWVIALLYLLVKYYGLKLGKDDEKPEFSDLTWFAMLFSCGVATGLWYFTAEGMWHYMGTTNRISDTQMYNDNTKAELAMTITFFHWGVHGWIPYVVVGAVIAIMAYRRDFPISMRFSVYPLIGEMCYGVIGDLIEVLSILCTVFGVCTSLGLGAMQINKGLVRLDRGTYRGQDHNGCTGNERVCEGNLGITEDASVQIVIIFVITMCATASVVIGLKKGIAILSQVAFGLSFFILISVFFMDNTWYIFNAVTSAFGYYLWYLPKISFHTDAWEELAFGQGGAPDGRGGKSGWMNNWTIFYWGWWISWGPFVGTFLARISKGRKLGQFIIASLILPSLWSFCFLGIFGAAQIRISNEAAVAGLTGEVPENIYGSLADTSIKGYWADKTGAKCNKTVATSECNWQKVYPGAVRLMSLDTEDVLFEHLQYYGGRGYGTFMTIITLICIVLYFVTSSDSASFVVDIMAANGIAEPPLMQKIFWAFTEGAAAAALLAASRDSPNPKAALNAVKALPIVLGLPFTFLLFWMCQSLVILCKEESGEWSMKRRHFQNFLLNPELQSFIAVLCPFIPLGQVASQTWGLQPAVGMVGFGLVWVSMIVLLIVGFVDEAFAKMGAGMYFCFALLAAGLRTAVRTKLKISGDMISDCCALCFAYPFAIGQMATENFEKEPLSEDTKLAKSELAI